jgi:hypothetical protein
MKMNKLLFYINKYKKIICLSLFVLVLGLLFHKPIIEGLTSDIIGEYDYLKPVTEIVSDDTWKQFIKSPSGMLVSCGGPNQRACTSRETQLQISAIKTVTGDVTTDEINYKIKNGYWPWGSYIANQATNGFTMFDNSKNITDPQQIQSDVEDKQKTHPTRKMYRYIGLDVSEKAMSPQPLSYKIYMGFTPPPVPGTTETTGTTGTTGTTASTNKYYNELVSLCKKINPV